MTATSDSSRARLARALISVTAVAALAGCSGELNPLSRLARLNGSARPTAVVPINLPVAVQTQLQDFDAFVKLLRDRHVNPKVLDGQDDAISDLRAQVAKGMTDERFAATLRQLIANLKNSGVDLQAASDPQPEVASGGLGLQFAPPEPGAERVLALVIQPNSAADRAGLRAHDAIVRINGQPVGLATQAELRSKLRGAVGSQVTVSVVSPGQPARDVVITRAPLPPSAPSSARRLPETHYAYIRLTPSDAADARDIVATALRGFAAQPADGLILDLRSMQSPAFPAYEVIELFSHGPAGAIVQRTGRQKLDVTGKNIAGSQALPLVVLVGDQTRGPAETLAGMLQDLGRAKLVGARTPGRTEVMTSANLPSGRIAVSFPTAEVRGQRDTSWHVTGPTPGVRPNTLLDLRFEDYTDDADPMLDAAVTALGR